jgi:hypothetical protein
VAVPRGSSEPMGPAACRILDLDFRELLFYDVGE